MFCQRSSGSRSQKRFLKWNYQPGPEDHHEDRPPARVLVIGMSLEDGPEDLVLQRVLGYSIPHERDDFFPGMESAEKAMLLLESMQEGLVGATTNFLCQSFTVFMS